jgi:hypothetical protein
MHQDKQTGQLVLAQAQGWRLLITQQKPGQLRPMVWEHREEGKPDVEVHRSTAPVVAMNARAAGSAQVSDIWHGREHGDEGWKQPLTK